MNRGYGLCLQKDRSPSRFHRFLENPGILESRMERSIKAVVPKPKVTLKFPSAAIIKPRLSKSGLLSNLGKYHLDGQNPASQSIVLNLRIH